MSSNDMVVSFKDMIDGVQGYDISLPNSYLKSFRYIE